MENEKKDPLLLEYHPNLRMISYLAPFRWAYHQENILRMKYLEKLELKESLQVDKHECKN